MVWLNLGEAARRVVGACYILTDFVNDREDLLTSVVRAGTLQHAFRALLILPPVPIPSGEPSPALHKRAMGIGYNFGPELGFTDNPPSGLARTRRATGI